ncbi:unnamed protein product [Triticum turgidum subsp. durum]|uniref:Acid phosphatase n=1 Tax=Triticum turgidum subsp. durum TaxID=4567 RepID=A0A9R1C2G4_TRITD|nr:unnamed protein product [Triticum turgidum subsp. durum]
MRRILLVLAAAAAVVVAGAESVLRQVTDVPTAVSSGVSDADALFCDSWRLSVETANAGPWRTVPARCGASVRAYMEGERYASDSAVAAAESLAFAAQAFASGVGGAMPAWVFDVDETLLSNAPYYAVSGWGELQRNATEENLLFAGYHSWEKLILRQISDIGKTAVQYKSERRAAMEAEGFKILGNSGDQWSDLIGLPMATRSFKLPNPMYFIS